MPARPKIAFMGTPDLARACLQALADLPCVEVVLVVAQPDKPVGRGLDLRSPPVKVESLARQIPLLQPASARDPHFLRAFRQASPDLAVVAAYGKILPVEALSIPRLGCLNVHTSLLPRWRGAAPIQWAILEGDSETGVTLMRMDEGLDTGDIVAVERTPIYPNDTGQTLHDRLAHLGAALLTRTLPDWLEGRISPRPQPPQGITYARKLTRDDGRLDWHQSAESLCRRVRAFDPWPGAFTFLHRPPSPPCLLKIWSARPITRQDDATPGEIVRVEGDELIVAAGEGAVHVEVLQREGRRRMSARDFSAGQDLRIGMRLGIDASPAPPGT